MGKLEKFKIKINRSFWTKVKYFPDHELTNFKTIFQITHKLVVLISTANYNYGLYTIKDKLMLLGDFYLKKNYTSKIF